MAAIVLAQVASSTLAPAIYGTLAAGASVAQAGFLWSLSQGLAGFAGSMVGSAIDNALFGSAGQSVQGPRLADLTVQASTDGAPLPLLFGTARLAGNVIWSTGLEEIASTQSQGGGGSGGGGGGSYTSYSYRTDVAVALCEGEITGIRRIWGDGKLLYEASDGLDRASLVASVSHAGDVRVYPGSETQDADPLIQAVEGAANAPAFRGTAYVVLEDLLLADFGNRLPNLAFEVVKTAPTTVPVYDDPESDPSYYEHGRLLLHFDNELGTGVVTDEHGHTIAKEAAFEFVADGLYDTPAGRFRYTSWYPVATHLTATPAYPSEFDLVGDFTVQAWVYHTGSLTGGTNRTLLDCRAGSGSLGGLFMLGNGSARLMFYSATTGNLGNVGDPIPILQWVHVAFVRTGSTLSAYLDGVRQWSVTLASQITGITDLRIGGGGGIAGGLEGYVEDFKLDIGYARWEDNFTPPTYRTIDTFPQGTEDLETVADTLCQRAGMAAGQYDMGALAADTVRGYVVARPMTMRAALDPLGMAYHFDAVEQDGKIVAVKRGGGAAATLAEDDLGAAEQPGASLVALTRNNASELPSEVQLTYSDIDNDFEPSTQTARWQTATHASVSAISLPLAMTSQEAARLAETLRDSAWLSGRHALSFACTYEQARLGPADVVSLPAYGRQWNARVTQVDLGAPGLLQVQAVPDLASLYTGYAVGNDASGVGQSLVISGPALAVLLDCCLLRDSDNAPGWYVAMGGYVSTWPGGVLWKSNDGGATWVEAASATRAQGVIMGYSLDILPAADCRVWDKAGRVTVKLHASATLASTTESNLLNGANAALLGAHGRWEMIQFLTASLNGDGSYTLSNLLRGRKGTEHAAASHAAGDRFVLLDAARLQAMDLSASEIGALRHFKAATAGKALEETLTQSATYAGERLECLAPVLLGGGRDASGNISLKWTRRDRINAGWNDYADVPMSEAAEAYEVDIYTDGSYTTVKRTLSGLASPAASYSSAQQVTDFGGNQPTIYARVYQLSASVGRGHYLQGSV